MAGRSLNEPEAIRKRISRVYEYKVILAVLDLEQATCDCFNMISRSDKDECLPSDIRQCKARKCAAERGEGRIKISSVRFLLDDFKK